MMRRIRKVAAAISLTLGVAIAASACAGEAGAAGEFPSRAVSVVVPFGAGGGTDLIARAIADVASDDFTRGIAVENRTGGGGAIGMVSGANAAADGHTITAITVELTTLPHMGTGADLGIDSFIPVIMYNSAYSVLTVNADSDFYTLDDVLAAAEAGDFRIGNSGIGAIWHLAAAALEQETGADFVHVPFDGAADAITSLLGNHIEAVTVSYPEVSAQVAAGALRVISVLAPERDAAIPDVPTAREAGFDVTVGTWRGFGVPAGTSDEVVGQLYDIFSAAAASDAFAYFMNNTNQPIDIQGPEAFATRIAADYDLFRALIADLGIAG